MSQDKMTYEEWMGATQKHIRPDSFWESELNASQWEAVRQCDGPLLVIAGAGSGKTRVLTYKVAYLLEHGYQPWQILALTFTNKAAREMNERIAKIVGDSCTTGLWSGTFHSIFAKILRVECDAIGFKHDFTIYDTSDQRSLLKTIIKEMQLDDKVYKPSIVASRISDAKNRLLLPNQYAADETILANDQMNNLGELHRIYSTYWQRCRTAEAMDFDDLLLYTYLLFDRAEDIRQKYAKRFRYILVDEYQDTNYAQHTIVSQLTKENDHICVVGDDAQSIYSFRGANIDNILYFTRQYPSAQTVKLERNYRSTQHIVEASNCIIRHNRGQIQKTVYSENPEGDKLTIMPAASDKEEATKVVGTIKRLARSEALTLNEFAVLYRTNAQSRAFEEAFSKAGIKVRLVGGLSFYQRKEIKDILAYIRLMINLDDEEAFKRIINYPTRGIGNTTLQKIITASREHNASLWAVTEQPAAYGLAINRGTLAKLESFCAMILEFRAKMQNVSAYALVKDIIETSGIKEDLAHEDGPEGDSKRENVQELLGAIHSYEKDTIAESGREYAPINDYLSQVALLTDADQKDDGQPKVTLMTIHASKGLEFEVVFVTGMEQELFPAGSAMLFPKEMEEERRLFYVAVTRAKRFCFLTYAKTRFRFGNMDFPEPSQFLDEIDKRYIRIESNDFERVATGMTPALRASLFDDDEPRQRPKDYGKKRQSIFDDEANSSREPAYNARPTSPQTTPSPTPSRTLKRASSFASTPATRAATQAKVSSLSIGSIIMHDRFGRGRVVGLEGAADQAKAQVDFENCGVKNLLLKFAKFTVIS